jgi:hypothetical protein
MLPLQRYFSSEWPKSNQKKTPMSRSTLRVAQAADDAAPHAAMRRCQACSGTHDLAIAARLAQTSRHAFSARIADARRGTKGMNPKKRNLFLATTVGHLTLPARREVV